MAKDRSDILNGLNIMQPVKKLRTHEKVKSAQTKNESSWQSFMCLHLKLLDVDHPLTFKVSKLRQIEAHALIYLSSHYLGVFLAAMLCKILESR